MFLHIDGIAVPKKLIYHVCFNDGRKLFYHMPEHLIPLGDTTWPEQTKDKNVKIFQVYITFIAVHYILITSLESEIVSDADSAGMRFRFSRVSFVRCIGIIYK
jgi:hypothetical protein